MREVRLWPMAEFFLGLLIVGGLLGWAWYGRSLTDALVGRLPPDQRLITAVAALDQAAFDAAVADGASFTSRDGSGMTALAYAAVLGKQSVVERLLAAGADINAQNNFGFTPLMQAANFDHPAIVELLLRHGADPTHRNRFGETAADRAREQGSPSAIAVFDKWAAARGITTPMQVARSRIDLSEGL